MKIVRAILWLPKLFLISVLVSGCGDSTGGKMPDNTTDTGETTIGAEMEVEIGSDSQLDIISWFTADINDDEKDELLIITNDSDTVMTLDTGERYGTHIKIYSQYVIQNNIPVPQGEPDHQFDLSDIKPLKIQAGDINGDGTAEIAVCVYKTAKFHPVPAKRPFFYDLIDGQLEPVWLGSRLARPYADYILFDVDDDEIEEIIAIEFAENGNKVLAVYDWKGFGFEVKAISDEITETITFLNNINNRADMVFVDIAGASYQVNLKEGEVIRCIKEY